MLKYGDLSLINNGNSRLLVPRNLTYRQKELFNSDINNSNINNSDFLNIIQINAIDIISDNISLLNTTPIIRFTPGNELIIKDDTINYIGFLNNNIKVYQPLDLSANGIIKFGTNLQISNGTSNVITINSATIDTSANISLLNTTPNIIFNDRLKLSNTTFSDNSSNAIVVYNTSSNDYEKKYIKKVTLTQTDTSMNVFFNNIKNSSTDSLTFTGKIVSVADISNSVHILFQGYTQMTNSTTSSVAFTQTQLFTNTANPLWKINSITLSGNNLIIQISDSNTSFPNRISNWIISLESISI